MKVWTPVALVLLSLALHAPCLGWGFFLDDHGQQLVFEGQTVTPSMSRFNVFDFGHAPRPGEPLFEGGGFPWWTAPGWKARFFRPLASWSMALDQRLFGRDARLHHLSGLALYALVLLSAWRLYLRAGFGPWTAVLALAVFALEDGSALVVGWIANRSTLLEALFAALALTAAFEARSSPRGPRAGGAALLAVGSAALATLAKESGLATLGLVALLLWRSHRAAALLAGLLAGTHAAFLVLGGYGARAALYPSPWLDGGLGPYLENLLFTLAVQPLAAVSPFPVDLVVFEPGARRAALVVGLVLTPLLALLVWRRARRAPQAGWFALWGLAALLPQSLAPASDRLVFVPALAWAPLVASFLTAELSRARIRAGGRLRAVPAALLALAALPLSGLVLGIRAVGTGTVIATIESVILEAELEPLGGPPPGAPLGGPLGAGRRDVLVLQYPHAVAGFAGGGLWAFETGDQRTRWFPLQLAGRGLEWTRVDERSFDLTSLDEPFCENTLETVFLDTPLAPPVGRRWRTAAFEVEARAVDAQGLRTVRVVWDEPLAPGRPVILTWRDGQLARVEPPALGERITLERALPLLDYVP